jgi:hypothetical protein
MELFSETDILAQSWNCFQRLTVNEQSWIVRGGTVGQIRGFMELLLEICMMYLSSEQSWKHFKKYNEPQ